jgi:integrase
MTGMREQEVMHCSWDDINLTRGTVTVRHKPEYGFSPKNYREREIPISCEAREGIEGSEGEIR